MNAAETIFLHGLREISEGLTLSEFQLHQLSVFCDNLILWNAKLNLTAITDPVDIYIKHFLDSCSALACVPRETFSTGARVIDVGTGAGFPGLPLAIAFPECHFTLADALNKRLLFIEDTLRIAAVENVTCVHGRAEELGHNPKYRGKYDIAVSRAVANLSTLNELCIPFLKAKGIFISYKSQRAEEELPAGNYAASILGAKLETRKTFVLPSTEYSRTILIFRKCRATSDKYPRKPGTPGRKPLGVK